MTDLSSSLSDKSMIVCELPVLLMGDVEGPGLEGRVPVVTVRCACVEDSSAVLEESGPAVAERRANMSVDLNGEADCRLAGGRI